MKKLLLLLLLLIPQASFARVGSCYTCHTCCARTQPCGWWGSAEYLLWWRKPRFFPPLVTTNPTSAPVLSDPATTILFGGETERRGPKQGGRGEFGVWLNRCLGIGGSGFLIGDEKVKYTLQESEVPIFGQPFFDTSLSAANVNLLAFPTLLFDGSIDVQSINRIYEFDLYFRYRMLGSSCFKLDLTAGFMCMTLTDKLDVESETTTALEGRFAFSDHFYCHNDYYAGLVGLVTEFRSSCWALMLTGKAGIGNMNKRIEISGSTTFNEGGLTLVEDESGLLAQPSNIGEYFHKKFEVVTQASAELQLKFYKHFWLTLGYTYNFWPAVALAGEQVDLNINPTQFPGPTVGDATPVFHERLNNYWTQGLTAGIYVRY